MERVCNLYDNYLDHANTRPNINKKVGIQIILVNLHELLLIADIGEGFLVYHLLKEEGDRDQILYWEILKVYKNKEIFSNIIVSKLTKGKNEFF